MSIFLHFKVCSIESSENFFEKNKEFLLENLQPMNILNESEIASLFDTNVTVKMGNLKSRKERADYFLGICNNLPPEKREMIVTYLKKSIPTFERGQIPRNWVSSCVID